MPPKTIAVLGGGLTGLSSAFHLSRRFPTSKIVLLEKQSRLGGWVRTARVELPQIGASVLLEGGPRTLRPNGKSVLELIHLLQLQDVLITIPKTAPPAQARYLYIPESHSSKVSGLRQLPSSILSMLSSPFLSMMLPSILLEPFKGRNREPGAHDEPLDSFLSRRFGETFARTFGSALVHGIYATDSRKLSVRAAFPILWQAEERGWGSMVLGMLMPKKPKKEDNYELGNTLDFMRGISVYSFRDGMATLTKAVEDKLRATSNVELLENTEVSALSPSEDQTIKISHSRGEPLQATHVVSALPLQQLQNLIQVQIPHLTHNPTSTVNVVNLVFPCPPSKIHPEGFGYLIPRPPSGYPHASDGFGPGILGTVFDSCSLHEQDLPATENYYTNASHTKLTMMTGGPYPRPALPSSLNSSDYENKDIPPFIQSLLEQLQTQLNKELPKPVYWRIWNSEACIPTLLPGHLDRMEEMQASILKKSAEWGGRLAVVGAGVGGVSVSDCIEAGRRVGKDWS